MITGIEKFFYPGREMFWRVIAKIHLSSPITFARGPLHPLILKQTWKENYITHHRGLIAVGSVLVPHTYHISDTREITKYYALNLNDKDTKAITPYLKDDTKIKTKFSDIMFSFAHSHPVPTKAYDVTHTVYYLTSQVIEIEKSMFGRITLIN